MDDDDDTTRNMSRSIRTAIHADRLLALVRADNIRERGNNTTMPGTNSSSSSRSSSSHPEEEEPAALLVAVTDENILHAFCYSGNPGPGEDVEIGSEHDFTLLDVCILLYSRLDERFAQELAVAHKCPSQWCPLHAAAYYGWLDVATWLVLKKGFNVNQTSAEWGRTALMCAADPFDEFLTDEHVEIGELLLQHGAQSNAVAYNGDNPLDLAVRCRHTGLIRLLVSEEYQLSPPSKCSVYCAIQYFEEELLSLLLEHGGRLDYPHVKQQRGTSNVDEDGDRDEDEDDGDDDDNHELDEDDEDDEIDEDSQPRTPLGTRFFRHEHSLRNVCRILVNHAQKNIDDTASFLLISIVDETDQQSCNDYIDAGVDKHLALLQAVQDNKEQVCQWLVELGADPFLVASSSSSNSSTNGSGPCCCWSPFQVAAGLEDMGILRYFVGLWNERFPSNEGGKDSRGESPIHALCRYQHVSIQAIQLLMQEFKANVSQAAVATSAAGDGGTVEEYALLPFHLAVMSDANLDVVFYLLRLHPDALTDKTTV